MIQPQPGRVYLVELCSGEQRHWCCTGRDARGLVHWRDAESGLCFSESSLMYAWRLIGEVPPDGGGAPSDG